MPQPSSRTRKRPIKRNPLLPDGVEIIIPPLPLEKCTFLDKLLVYASSLIIVGSPIWFYGGLLYLFRKWKHYHSLSNEREKCQNDSTNAPETSGCQSNDNQEMQRRTQQQNQYRKLAKLYGAVVATIVLFVIWGPYRKREVGARLGVQRWRLWEAWLNYLGFTVIKDHGDGRYPTDYNNRAGESSTTEFDIQTSPAIFAFVPHGIVPFGLAWACLPERGYHESWGQIRPVVATATKLFPVVRTLIEWMGGVDASRSTVSQALMTYPRRLGITPGGIAEMFETYPKPGYHPDDEAALIKSRNGMFKLAMRHNVPVVPVYCFGATKLFHRVQLPAFMETLSRLLKISLCLFYGKWGLPIPFQQQLMYVMGKTIFPPLVTQVGEGEDFDRGVEEMHNAFCDEITRIFDRNKEFYGWSHKTLRLV